MRFSTAVLLSHIHQMTRSHDRCGPARLTPVACSTEASVMRFSTALSSSQKRSRPSRLMMASSWSSGLMLLATALLPCTYLHQHVHFQ